MESLISIHMSIKKRTNQYNTKNEKYNLRTDSKILNMNLILASV